MGAHSCPRGEVSYRHRIGGEAFGVSFEPGDPVDPDVPAEKLDEWLAAEPSERRSWGARATAGRGIWLGWLKTTSTSGANLDQWSEKFLEQPFLARVPKIPASLAKRVAKAWERLK